MSNLGEFRRRFAYESWANGEVLGGLRTMDPLTERSRHWLAHIVGTQELWMSRLKEDGLAVEVWPDLDLDAIEARLEGIRGAWEMYFDGLDAADLAREVSYTNTKGECWSNAIGEILEHVLLHGAYHRGQIAAEVRAEGGEPAYTDFIHCMRQGKLERA